MGSPRGNACSNVFSSVPYCLKPTRAPLEDSGGALLRPRPVHRLDKLTGGLLIVAKTNVAMTKLGSDFRTRKVHKKYIALVHGKPKEPAGSFDAPIQKKNAFTSYTAGRTWENILNTASPKPTSHMNTCTTNQNEKKKEEREKGEGEG